MREVEHPVPVHVQDGVEADPVDVEEKLGDIAREVLVAVFRDLSGCLGTGELAKPSAGEVHKMLQGRFSVQFGTHNRLWCHIGLSRLSR